MFTLPMKIEKSIVIDRSVNDVYETVANFNTWRDWSPWLCQEPECSVSVIGAAGKQGHKQHWDGKRIGSGEMALISSLKNTQISYDLTFLKPWKSHCKVAFDFSEQEENKTRLTWCMDGTLPIFMFFMREPMTAMVGSDYERGLTMLKELEENGSVPSIIDVAGKVRQNHFYYVGLTNQDYFNDFDKTLHQNFEVLDQCVLSGEIPAPDFKLSIYFFVDLAHHKLNVINAFAYRSGKGLDAVSIFKKGHIASHSALCVDHLGSLRYLENAWATVENLKRNSKDKFCKNTPAYEVYFNIDEDIKGVEYKTRIYLPLR